MFWIRIFLKTLPGPRTGLCRGCTEMKVQVVTDRIVALLTDIASGVGLPLDASTQDAIVVESSAWASGLVKYNMQFEGAVPGDLTWRTYESVLVERVIASRLAGRDLAAPSGFEGVEAGSWKKVRGKPAMQRDWVMPLGDSGAQMSVTDTLGLEGDMVRGEPCFHLPKGRRPLNATAAADLVSVLQEAIGLAGIGR